MKKLPLILSSAALAGAIALSLVSCSENDAPKTAPVESESTVQQGAIVYFNLDRVLAEYDMANDLGSVFQTKAQGIDQEVQRRANKFQKDLNTFQDKLNKGLMTQSTAQIQSQKLEEQQASVNNYAAQKQQELLEEQQVMMNQISDAIKTFVDEYNAKMGYAMIIAVQGEILPLPIVSADASLDITDALIEGLNAAYVKEKGKSE